MLSGQGMQIRDAIERVSAPLIFHPQADRTEQIPQGQMPARDHQ
jgi:hypothetical protein